MSLLSGDGRHVVVRSPGVDMRWRFGDVTITKIVEIEVPVPLAGLLPDATPAALAAHADWLAPHFVDREGTAPLSIHSFVIESDGSRILVDTCVGDRELPGLDAMRGDPAFLDRLADAGFPVESIDIVCCTHLHFDHVGWNTRWDGERWVPTFPSARYLFCRAEYEAWMAESSPFAMNLPDTVGPVIDAGLAELVEPDLRVTSQVRFVPTPGHSPGHMSVLVESNGTRAFITGDMSHHPVQWAETDWGFVGDHDGALAAESRRWILDEHGDAGTVVLGTHYASPTAGHLVRRDGGWIFTATDRREW